MEINTSDCPSLFADTFWPKKTKTNLLRALILVLGGSILLTFSAKIQVPFWPVPITMQTMVTLMLGLGLGWRIGGAAYALYIIEGAAGLPVFAGTPEKGIGITYILGPTGGYLLGMFLACIIAGKLAERGWDKKILTTAAAMFIGNIIIYIPGLVWLGIVVGWTNPILEWGFYPFLYGDVLKIILGAILMPTAWKFLSWAKT